METYKKGTSPSPLSGSQERFPEGRHILAGSGGGRVAQAEVVACREKILEIKENRANRRLESRYIGLMASYALLKS